jgi:RHS repeat-associated protein
MVYDAFNRRIASLYDNDSAPDSTERYVRDGSNVVLDFVDADGAGTTESPELARRYLWGAAVDQLFAQEDVDSNSVDWMLTDNLGSVRDIVHSDGSLVTHYTYDTFGSATATVGNLAETRYQFTCQEYDPATAFYYYDPRWYDPRLGRFINLDPTGLRPDANPYRYCGNGPVNGVDPSGLAPPPVPYYAAGQAFLDSMQFVNVGQGGGAVVRPVVPQSTGPLVSLYATSQATLVPPPSQVTPAQFTGSMALQNSDLSNVYPGGTISFGQTTSTYMTHSGGVIQDYVRKPTSGYHFSAVDVIEEGVTAIEFGASLDAARDGLQLWGTAERFGDEWGKAKGNSDDWANAARHGYWQAMLAGKHGVSDAKADGDAHEIYEPLDSDQFADYWNNRVGREIGAAIGYNPNRIRQAVEDALNEGTEGRFIILRDCDKRIPKTIIK